MVLHCTIEYLQNLHQLLVYIPIDTSITNFDSKLFLNRSLKTLSIDQNEADSQLLISVPGKLGLSRLALPVNGPIKFAPQVNRIDNVLILQFRNFYCSNVDTVELMQPLTSKDLAVGINSIVCKSCSHVLKAFGNDSRPVSFHDLPNEHWLELLDCWSCHDNEFAPIAERALGQTNFTPDPKCSGHKFCNSSNFFSSKSYEETNNSDETLILPKPGKIFIGLRHIFFNLNDFDLVQCSQCSAALGSKIKAEYLKINRETIQYFANDSKTLGDSFVTILMHQILDIIDNHSTFHFVMIDSSGRRKLYMKPLSWNTRIFDETSNSWKFAFKIGFSETFNTSRADAEIITCSEQQFDEIKSILQNTHKNMLFGSSIRIPGSEELYLSYLIN